MADERRKILLELNIDSVESIKTLSELKSLQKEINKELENVDIGSDEYKKLEQNLGLVEKRYKGLKNETKQSTSELNVQGGSLRDIQAQYNRLTKAIREAAPGQKVMGMSFEEAQQKALGLKNEIKDFEAKLGNFTPNVGNYAAAIKEAGLGTGLLGGQLGGAVQGFQGLLKGIQSARLGFVGLRAAIISTGIGALVVALISLIQYFTSTDNGATQLAGIMGALGAVVRRITGFFAQLGEKIVNAFSSFENLGQALKDLGEFIVQNIINRFKSVLVFGEAISLLFEGRFSEAAKKGADAIIQLNTGIEDGTSKLAAMGNEMSEAAKRAYDFAVAMDDIKDAQRDLSLEEKKAEKQIDKLIIQSKNRTLSVKERIALLKEANRIEKETSDKAIALKKRELDLIKQRNAEEQKSIGNNKLDDKLVQEQIDLEKELIELEIKSSNIREKNQNRIDQFKEQAINDELNKEKLKAQVLENIEKERFIKGEINQKQFQQNIEKINIESLERQKDILKRYGKDVSEIDKSILDIKIKHKEEEIKHNEEEIKAETEMLKRIKKSEEALLEFRKQNEIKSLELDISNSKKSAQERIAAIDEKIKKEIELEELKKEAVLHDEKLLASERILIEAEFDAKKTEIERKGAEARLAIAEKEKQEKINKFQQATDTFVSLTDQAANAITTANEARLNNELTALEEAKQRELKAAGNNAAAKEKIEEKFENKRKQAERDAAKRAGDIAKIQALINTAQAVTKSLTAAPFPLNIALAAGAAAAGFAQIAKIESEQNKLAEGGLIKHKKFAFGGIIGGHPHSMGGTKFVGSDGSMFEAERGELLAVVNKKDTELLQALSAFNSIHGKPFFRDGGIVQSNYLQDGGFAARSTSAPVIESLSQRNQLVDIVSSIKFPPVTVEDINAKMSSRTQVVSRANI